MGCVGIVEVLFTRLLREQNMCVIWWWMDALIYLISNVKHCTYIHNI